MAMRRFGQIVAVLVGAGVAVLILIGIQRSGQNTAPPPTLPEDMSNSLPTPPDGRVTDSPMQDSAIQRIENLALTRVNPETGRLEARLAWEALEPEANGLVSLTKPEAWIYDRASVLHIRADAGRLVWLSREEEELPESGDLTGNVRIRVYELEPEWSDDPSQRRDESGALMLPLVASVDTEALHFESALGEVTTQDDLVVEASGATFEGTGLVLRISEVAQFSGVERRLQYLRIDEGRRLIIRNEAEKASSLAGAESGTSKGSTGPKSPPVVDSEVLYHMTVDDSVVLQQAERRIESEHVDAWVRIVNRQLPEDAIASLPSRLDSNESGRTGSKSGDRQQPDPTAEADGPVELLWNGPLEIRTLRQVPEQLRLDDVAVAFSSPRANEVRFADAGMSLNGRVVSMSYGLTSQRLALLGVGGRGVELNVPDGTLLTGRVDVDLAQGLGSFTGPGELRSSEMTVPAAGQILQRARPRQSAVWSDGAEFSFGFDEVSGDLVPTDARLNGAVELRDADRLMSGNAVFATFQRVDGDEPWVALTGVEVDGEALVASGDRDGVRASRIDAAFEIPTEAGRLGNMRALAEGDVRARSGDQEILAEIVEVDAESMDDGSMAPRRVQARHSVRVAMRPEADPDASREELVVDADQLDATFGDPVDGERGPAMIDIQGAPATLTRRREGEQGVLEARSLRIDEAAERVTVFGEGRADQTLARGTTNYDALGVQWTDGLVYEGDDVTGQVEVMGDIVGRGELDDVQRHLVQGERLVLHFNRSTDSASDEQGTWRLSGATIEGDPLAEGEDRLAQVESRRYFPATDGAPMTTLEGLGMLAGPEIHATNIEDVETGQVDVPGAGILMIEDRRHREANAEPREVFTEDESIFGESFRDLRGTTVFDWTGSFHLTGETGEMEMRRQVRLRHRHPDAQAFMELECEHLKAWAERRTDESGRPIEPELTRVIAEDGVFARHGHVELVCDRLEYDTSTAEVVATASPGSTVTLFDADRGVHYRSESVTLDVRTGEWKSSGAETVRFPG